MQLLGDPDFECNLLLTHDLRLVFPPLWDSVSSSWGDKMHHVVPGET